MAPLRQSHTPPPVTPGAPAGRWLGRPLAGPALRRAHVLEAAGLCRDDGPDARARHRRHHRDLQRRLRRAAEAAALPRARAAGRACCTPCQTGAGNQSGPATYFTYRDNQRVFEAIGAWESNEVSITGRGDPERVEALAVSDATLPLLRVQPLLGRVFNADDDTPGTPLRAVLTYGYWQRRFGGAEHVDRPVARRSTARPREVIGVLPASFRFLREQSRRSCCRCSSTARRAGCIEFDFQALARLKPGVTLAQANADMARMIPLLPPSRSTSLQTAAGRPPAGRRRDRRRRAASSGFSLRPSASCC